jgi:hypothetical protein
VQPETRLWPLWCLLRGLAARGGGLHSTEDPPRNAETHATSSNTDWVEGRIFCVGDRQKGVGHSSWSTTGIARHAETLSDACVCDGV